MLTLSSYLPTSSIDEGGAYIGIGMPPVVMGVGGF